MINCILCGNSDQLHIGIHTNSKIIRVGVELRFKIAVHSDALKRKVYNKAAKADDIVQTSFSISNQRKP